MADTKTIMKAKDTITTAAMIAELNILWQMQFSEPSTIEWGIKNHIKKKKMWAI